MAVILDWVLQNTQPQHLSGLTKRFVSYFCYMFLQPRTIAFSFWDLYRSNNPLYRTFPLYRREHMMSVKASVQKGHISLRTFNWLKRSHITKLNINWAGGAVNILKSNTIYCMCVFLKYLIYDQMLYMLTMLINPLNFWKKKYHNVVFHTIKYILHMLYILYCSLQKSKN